MPTGPRPAPPAGVARVALLSTWQGHQCVNTFWLQLTHGAVTVDDLKTIADAIAAAFHTDVMSLMNTDFVLHAVDITFIPTAGTELRYTGTYSFAGSGTGNSVADASASYVIDWTISDYYRGGHPRSYIAGVLRENVTNGSDIVAGVQSSAATAFNTFRNHVNALTSTNISAVVMGTVRFQSALAWLSPPRFVAYTSVKYGNRGKLGSQRRRIKS